MAELKNVTDLPETQQKVLFIILKMKKPAFLTSEVQKKLSDEMMGRSVGALLGALYRNGFLTRLQGGRDKKWKLSDSADRASNDLKHQIMTIRQYWSQK